MPVRLSSHRLPFSLSIADGVTYEKNGGATADWEAGGALTRKRRRNRAIVLPRMQPATPATIYEKSGGGRSACEARGRVSVEKQRSGGVTADVLAGGAFTRTLRGRTGAAGTVVQASGTHIRIYAPRNGVGVVGGATGGARFVVYAEIGRGHGRWAAFGATSILRGDDSEELMLLGLEPEDEELLILG